MLVVNEEASVTCERSYELQQRNKVVDEKIDVPIVQKISAEARGSTKVQWTDLS